MAQFFPHSANAYARTSLVVLAVVGAVVIKLQQWTDRLVAPWAHQDEH